MVGIDTLAHKVKSGGAQHHAATNICLRILIFLTISVLQVSVCFFQLIQVQGSANLGNNSLK